MKIYIDSQYRCHTTNPDGTFREVETDFFDGKCTEFIEGHCYENGEITVAIYPWKDYNELDAAQRLYEQALILDMQQALKTLGVNVDG